MAAEAQFAALPVSITVNGVKHDALVEPRTLLVYFLREHLNLTGTHVGCDTSQCGACTVHLNGRAVKSCTVLAVQANGAEVKTIEGLADGDNFHPVQEGFREKHGLAVRLLHAGHDHDRGAFVGNQSQSDRRRDQARPRRQPVPLHRLRQHRRVDQMGRREDEGRSEVMKSIRQSNSCLMPHASCLLPKGGCPCFPLISAMSRRARSKKRCN